MFNFLYNEIKYPRKQLSLQRKNWLLNCLYRDMGTKFEFPEGHILTYEYTK